MLLTHQIRLVPNRVQATQLERYAGAARFAYNWGLARWQAQYQAGEKTSWQSINKALNACKSGELAWLREIPWAVLAQGVRNLGNAFNHFFRRVKTGEKPGYPRFKAKHRSPPSFYIEGRSLQFDGRRVYLPKLKWLKTRQALRFPGRVVSAQFKKRAGRWYCSAKVEIDETLWVYPHGCETQTAVGVDLGVRDLAVLSTGQKFPAPRVLRCCERKLRRLNKTLSRRKRGGSRWRKAKAKLARLHERIANIRKDVIHKLTAWLVQQFRWIGVEDLNVVGMAQNHKLAKSVMDAAMAEVLRQLAYKVELAGGSLVVADRWFPSTKRCSSCGHVEPVVLGQQSWECPGCGACHDRDINAAENLRIMAAAHAATAQRPGSSGVRKDTKLPVGWESSLLVNQG